MVFLTCDSIEMKSLTIHFGDAGSPLVLDVPRGGPDGAAPESAKSRPSVPLGAAGLMTSRELGDQVGLEPGIRRVSTVGDISPGRGDWELTELRIRDLVPHKELDVRIGLRRHPTHELGRGGDGDPIELAV